MSNVVSTLFYFFLSYIFQLIFMNTFLDSVHNGPLYEHS